MAKLLRQMDERDRGIEEERPRDTMPERRSKAEPPNTRVSSLTAEHSEAAAVHTLIGILKRSRSSRQITRCLDLRGRCLPNEAALVMLQVMLSGFALLRRSTIFGSRDRSCTRTAERSEAVYQDSGRCNTSRGGAKREHELIKASKML